MIFENGLRSDDMECPECKRMHYNVQVGEEALICGCGAVFEMHRSADGIAYYCKWSSIVRDEGERYINDDPRNLN